MSRKGRRPLDHKWWGLVFVLPVVVFFALFSVFPVLFGFYLSLTDYDLLNPPEWVGLDNFRNLLDDKLFLRALANTLVFVAGSTVPVWVLSLLAALLFDQAFRGRVVLQAVFILPILPPVVVVAVVWRMLLHPNGIATWIAGSFHGISEIRWLADTVLAPLAMIAVHDWAVIPFFALIWLAGLAGIAPELHEAARIDGATAVETFWHVDLPQLRSTAVLVAALSTINSFQTFTLQYVLAPDPGGPANSTLVLALLVLKYGFQYFRMGDAAAVSVVMFAIILALTAVQLWFNRRVN
ncbi:MAG: sugar ABC transporter permease [Proteobacteria bacterium]|nr:sugar ABC transporter permease [Pseudomonadota bacterium]MBI3498866.1 sugar ABC transporter permease [Pseudomonadota bacterium]